MSIDSFEEAKEHIGHKIVVVAYGDEDDPVNVAIECETCGCVLKDWDSPEVEEQ